jgi:hypothetical protein
MQDQPPPYGQPPYSGYNPPPYTGYPGGPPPRRSRDVWRGVGLAFLLHLLQAPLGVLSYGVTIIFIGITQLVYLIPAIVVFSKKSRPDMVKGLLIGGAITFLLNAACTGLFFILLSGADFR